MSSQEGKVTLEYDKSVNKGDKLYRIVYWNSFCGQTRELDIRAVKKVTPKKFKFYGYDYWENKSCIGVDWFLTKQDAIRNALTVHQKEYGGIIREIKCLERWLKRLTKKN